MARRECVWFTAGDGPTPSCRCWNWRILRGPRDGHWSASESSTNPATTSTVIRRSWCEWNTKRCRRLASGLEPMNRYAVPRPRLILPRLQTVVLDFVAGPSLEPSMAALRYTAGRRAGLRLERQFWQLGRWLHHYQGGAPPQWGGPDALQSVLQHCDHRLRIVQRTGHPGLPADLYSRVWRRLENWQRALAEPVPVGPCHGDFGPWNVLVTDSQLTVLDFCASRQDCLWVDPLGVLVYLESQRHAPSFSHRRIRRLQEVFLRGYACAANPPVPLVAICESLHRICRLQDGLQHPAPSIVDRYQRRRVMRDNLQQLLYGQEPLYTKLARHRPSGTLTTESKS